MTINGTTGTGGKATFELAPGDYQATLTKAGYTPAAASFKVDNQSINVYITVKAIKYAVTFTVTDGTNPLPGATVAIAGQEPQQTNASGQAVFNLKAGTYAYTVTAEGYQEASGSVNVVDQAVNEAVTMTAVYTVTFTVTDSATAAAIAGATVTVTGQTPQNTDENGQAVFTLEAGSYPYTVDYTGYTQGTGTVTVVDQAIVEAVALVAEVNTDSNIALVTEDKTHRAATYIRDVLVAKGHTVTLFNRTEMTASNLDSYDVIVTPRLANDATSNSYLRAYIDKGIPVWIGMVGGVGATINLYDHPAVGVGMVAKLRLEDSRQGSYLLDINHPISEPFAKPLQFNTYGYSTYMDRAYRADGFVGTPIANYGSALTDITVLAIEKNTNDLFGNPYGARCGYIGWMYSLSTNTLTAEAQTIIDRAIRWSREG